MGKDIVSKVLAIYVLVALVAIAVAMVTPLTFPQALVFWLLAVVSGLSISAAGESKIRDEAGLALLAVALLAAFSHGWPGWYGFAATVLGVTSGWLLVIVTDHAIAAERAFIAEDNRRCRPST